MCEIDTGHSSVVCLIIATLDHRSHIAENKDIIRLLVEGYEKPQVHALSCGLMLRECIKKDQLARLVTEDEVCSLSLSSFLRPFWR